MSSLNNLVFSLVVSVRSCGTRRRDTYAPSSGSCTTTTTGCLPGAGELFM